MDGEPVAAVPLTHREQQVAALIACRYSNRQISGELAIISSGTVANHVSHILAKLGCRNRTEVAMNVQPFTEVSVHGSGLPGSLQDGT